MKRFICLTLMLALVLTVLIIPTMPASAGTSYTVKATSSVNLRKGPGLGYDKITSISKGKTLTYKGISKFDSRGIAWHKVSYDGGSAWISWRYSNLCKNGSAISESKWVRATASVNVRKGAGTSYSKLTTVSKGTKLVYLGESTKVGGTRWYKVSCSDGIGWVSSAYSSLSKVVSSVGSSSSSGTKILTTGQVHLRDKPSLSGKRLATIPNGTTLTYKGDSSVDTRNVTWYKVSYNGTTGWVSSKYSKKVS